MYLHNGFMFIVLGTMNVLLLLLAMFNNGIAITEFKELEKYLLTKLGKKMHTYKLNRTFEIYGFIIFLFRSTQKTCCRGGHERTVCNDGSIQVNVRTKFFID